MAGLKSKKIQPQEDSDEQPIITNIDDPWEEESEEDERIGVSINAAGRGTELVVVENGVRREEAVHASHDIHVEESAVISKSTSSGGSSDATGGGDSSGTSPKVQVEAEVMPEMVALSVIAQQQAAEQDETAAAVAGGGGEGLVPEEGEGEGGREAMVVAESEETQEKEEGAGKIDEGPLVIIEDSAEPIMTVNVEIQVS